MTTEAEYESERRHDRRRVDGRGFDRRPAVFPARRRFLPAISDTFPSVRVTIPRPDVKLRAATGSELFIDRLAWNKLERLGIEPELKGATTPRFCVARTSTSSARQARRPTRLLPSWPIKAADKRCETDRRAPGTPRVRRLLDHAIQSICCGSTRPSLTPGGRGSCFTSAGDTPAVLLKTVRMTAMVRELVTAKGNVKAEGPAAYFKAMVDTPELHGPLHRAVGVSRCPH